MQAATVKHVLLALTAASGMQSDVAGQSEKRSRRRHHTAHTCHMLCVTVSSVTHHSCDTCGKEGDEHKEF
jgi:hypothetical protein